MQQNRGNWQIEEARKFVVKMDRIKADVRDLQHVFAELGTLIESGLDQEEATANKRSRQAREEDQSDGAYRFRRALSVLESYRINYELAPVIRGSLVMAIYGCMEDAFERVCRALYETKDEHGKSILQESFRDYKPPDDTTKFAMYLKDIAKIELGDSVILQWNFLRKIRNKFAHSNGIVDLDSEQKLRDMQQKISEHKRCLPRLAECVKYEGVEDNKCRIMLDSSSVERLLLFFAFVLMQTVDLCRDRITASKQ